MSGGERQRAEEEEETAKPIVTRPTANPDRVRVPPREAKPKRDEGEREATAPPPKEEH